MSYPRDDYREEVAALSDDTLRSLSIHLDQVWRLSDVDLLHHADAETIANLVIAGAEEMRVQDGGRVLDWAQGGPETVEAIARNLLSAYLNYDPYPDSTHYFVVAYVRDRQAEEAQDDA